MRKISSSKKKKFIYLHTSFLISTYFNLLKKEKSFFKKYFLTFPRIRRRRGSTLLIKRLAEAKNPFSSFLSGSFFKIGFFRKKQNKLKQKKISNNH